MMRYYLALKRKEILTHDTTQVNLEDIMLSEISNTQKNKCVMIPLILVPMVVKIQIEGRIQAAKGWEREDEEFMFKVDCFSLER